MILKSILLFWMSIFTIDGKSSTVEEDIRNKQKEMIDNLTSSIDRRLVDKYTGETIVEGNYKNAKLSTDLLEWYYTNGVLHIAILNAARTSGSSIYFDYVKNNYDFILKNFSSFEKAYIPGKPYESYFNENHTPFWQMFMMSELDHCGSMSAGLADLYLVKKDKNYRAILDKTADFITNKQLRLGDNTLVRPTPRRNSLWLDDLYMSVPFLARYAKISKNNEYLDDACLQVINFNKYLFNSDKGYYHHFKFTDTIVMPFAYWARANGWAAMAKTELLSLIPDSYPQKDTILKIYRRHINGLIKCQDKSGMWRQLLDHEEAYFESSSTSMFIYAIARGVNEGWLEKSYIEYAIKGWIGLSERIKNGVLEDICVGTPIGMSKEFYLNRATSSGDTHGMAAAILAASELIRYYDLMNK